MTYTPPEQYPPIHPAPFGYPYYPPQLKHSSLGIASFVISIVAGLGEMTLVVIAGVMTANAGPEGMNERDPTVVALGLGLIAGILLTLIGFVLGLVGCFMADRKKIFAVLGSVFNGLVLLIVLGLMVLGMSMK